MADYGEDYLLDKRVKIFQPDDGYRASVDAVFLSALVGSARRTDSRHRFGHRRRFPVFGAPFSRLRNYRA